MKDSSEERGPGFEKQSRKTRRERALPDQASKISRRDFLVASGVTMAAGLAATTLVGCHSSGSDDEDTSVAAEDVRYCGTFRIGQCVSPFTERMLGNGIKFTDGSRTATDVVGLQRLWMARGSSEIFTRFGSALMNNGVSTRDQLASRCALAEQVGIPLNPELTICGTYGDISRQPPPNFADYPLITIPGGKRWSQLSITEMCDILRQYGTIEAQNILSQTSEVNVWDIGNEVEYGLAGVAIKPSPTSSTYEAPDAVNPEIGLKSQQGGFFGDLNWLQNELWPYIAQMLTAVAEGIREVDPNAKVATHTSTIPTFLPGWLTAFHQAMADSGFHADQLGTSWYPGSTSFGANAFEQFKTEVALIRSQLGVPVYVAEYAYAAGPAIYNGANWANPVNGYPVDEAGQAALLRDLTAWGAQTGNISGIRPWAPDLVDGGWSGLAMFQLLDDPKQLNAVARPSVGSMLEGLTSIGAAPKRC